MPGNPRAAPAVKVWQQPYGNPEHIKKLAFQFVMPISGPLPNTPNGAMPNQTACNQCQTYNAITSCHLEGHVCSQIRNLQYGKLKIIRNPGGQLLPLHTGDMPVS